MRRGRIALWSGCCLLLVFGSLSIYDWYLVHYPPDVYAENSSLINELKAAPLDNTPPAKSMDEDWPQWRGPRRDGISLATARTRWPEDGLRVLWRAPCGEGYSGVAVSRGQAFTLWREGEDEVIGCWDAVTGEPRWRRSYPVPCSLPYGKGPRSTPTVDDDRLYTVGATGVLHCLRAATGETLWRKDLLQEYKADNLLYGTSFSPLIEGNLLLTNPGGPNGQSIVAFDKHSGSEVWSSLDDKAGYSSPIAVTAAGVRQLIFFTGVALVSLAPADGKLYWRFDWDTFGGNNVATPIVHGDYVFISSGYQRGCALVKIVASKEGPRVERVYETRKMCNHFSTCILHRGYLYGFTDPNMLVCMELSTGEIRWRERGFGKGTVLGVGAQLLVLDENGTKLVLVEAKPDKYQQIALCRLAGEKCWSVPSLAQRQLYLRTTSTDSPNEIICFEFPVP